jgi:hypothetical protein
MIRNHKNPQDQKVTWTSSTAEARRFHITFWCWDEWSGQSMKVDAQPPSRNSWVSQCRVTRSTCARRDSKPALGAAAGLAGRQRRRCASERPSVCRPSLFLCVSLRRAVPTLHVSITRAPHSGRPHLCRLRTKRSALGRNEAV